MNKKFKQSDALNVRKYRGGANEKLNAVISPKKRESAALSNGGKTDLTESIDKILISRSPAASPHLEENLLRISVNTSSLSREPPN